MTTNTTILLLGGLGAVAVFGVIWLIRGIADRRKEHWQRRLGGRGPDDTETLVQQASAQPPDGWRDRMDNSFALMVQRTGLELSTEQALGVTCLLGVTLATGLHLWRGELWLTVLGLVVGMGAPLALFMYLQARYRRLLQNQIPDAFYLLARSLRAGLSLEQGLALLGAQGARPLADEFKKCSAQVQLGLTIPVALQLMASRLQLVDVNAFASTVAVYQATGGNLALLLDRLAAGARDRNQFRGHFLAATALGRATAMFLAAAFPVLLLVYLIFFPEHIQPFFHSQGGWIAFVVAILLEVIGTVWLYNLLNVQY
jgi:tight adherence protein B